MTNVIVRVVIGMGLLTLAGCPSTRAAIRFSETGKNIALPEHFRSRNLFGAPGPLIYKIEDFAGIIVEEVGPNRYKRLYKVAALDDDLKLEIPDGKGQPIYESKIDKSAGLKGSYLAFAANFATNHVEHIQIMDIGLVFAAWKKVRAAEKEISQWTKENPANGKKRYLVQGALLTLILGTSTNVVATGSQVSTPVFKVNGEIRRLGSTTRRDYQVSLALIDVSTLIGPGKKALLDPIYRLFRASEKGSSYWAEGKQIDVIHGLKGGAR